MENKKLTEPFAEELKEEDLCAASGGSDNSKFLISPSRGMDTHMICSHCGQYKPIVATVQGRNYYFCQECWDTWHSRCP